MRPEHPDADTPIDTVQSAYRTGSQDVRASFGLDRSRAQAFYKNLVDFIVAVAPTTVSHPRSLLDVGCGSGWSTWSFAENGYDAVGIDLNPDAFEPPPRERMRLLNGNATKIPFADASYSIVVAYQCLEHVPDPQRALGEMIRVCAPGGIVAVVGPNLVSPFTGLRFTARPSSWPGLAFRRVPGMPRHPYGNTIGEVIAASFHRSWQLLQKLASTTPTFSMRIPDTVPPFHADNDACYLCNPTDLIRAFRRQGLKVARRGRPGRFPGTYLFAGGTWVAARKPG